MSAGQASGADTGRQKTRRTKAGVVKPALASSWDEEDDPFLDSLEAEEHKPGEQQTQRVRRGGGTVVEAISETEGAPGTARRRTSPQMTSISALFGGGGSVRNGGVAPAPRTRAGTKRPRPGSASAVTQGERVRPPSPLDRRSGSFTGDIDHVDLTNDDSPDRYGATTGAGSAAAGGGRSASSGRLFPLGGSRKTGRRDGAWGIGKNGGPMDGRGSTAVVEDQLWPDKYQPKSVSNLAVHAKKVEEVRHWMTMALSARPGSGMYRLLAVVGPPGSAKSTMVRVLAEEMGVELLEWQLVREVVSPAPRNDSGVASPSFGLLLASELGSPPPQDTSGQGGPAYRPSADGPALREERPTHEFGSGYQSAIDSFDEFMRRSSYSPLSLVSKAGSATGSGAACSLKSRRGGVRETGVRGGRDRRGQGIEGGRGAKARMVLVEELPGVYTEKSKMRLRELVGECTRWSPCPIVIVWSQATENSSYQSQLESVLSRENLRAPGVQITTCNPINDTLLRQHLKAVLVKEGVPDPRGSLVEGAIASCRAMASAVPLPVGLSSPADMVAYPPADSLVSVRGAASIALRCGDIRHALLDLQMRVAGSRKTYLGDFGNSLSSKTSWRGSGVGRKSRNGTLGVAGSGVYEARPGRDARTRGVEVEAISTRDPFYSQFHAVGKLLYAKRVPSAGSDARVRRSSAVAAGTTESGNDARDPLGFVPEEVMTQSGMGLDSAIEFLQCHCVDLYTDEDDLALGLGYMSDAELFASRKYGSFRNTDANQGIFPERYAESIAARATAFANRHPAKGRMRTFGAPKSYEMRRERVEAMDAMRGFVKDAWEASGGDVRALWASSRHPKEVVDTELLPAARLISGQWRAEPALRSLLHRFVTSPSEIQGGYGSVSGVVDEERATRHGGGVPLPLPLAPHGGSSGDMSLDLRVLGSDAEMVGNRPEAVVGAGAGTQPPVAAPIVGDVVDLTDEVEVADAAEMVAGYKHSAPAGFEDEDEIEDL